jgi:tetratricopeptide (TPR) repeat protein
MRTPFLLRLLLACSFALAAGSASGQSVSLKDGRTLSDPQLQFDESGFVLRSREGDAVIERRTPYAEVLRMSWPEPEEVVRARTLLEGGKPEEAATLAEGVMRRFDPTRTLMGSPWQTAAAVRLGALARLGRDLEVAAVMRRMQEASNEAGGLTEARLAMAEASLRKRAYADARRHLDEALADAQGDQAARGSLLAGDLALEQSVFEEALRAYLRIPVFHHRLTALQPRALLGAARAYRGLGDQTRSSASYEELIERFPASDEARLASSEKAALANR